MTAGEIRQKLKDTPDHWQVIIQFTEGDQHGTWTRTEKDWSIHAVVIPGTTAAG